MSKPIDADAVLDRIQKFIADNRISCAETIYQVDRVIVHAFEFIEDLCELVGYHSDEEA